MISASLVLGFPSAGWDLFGHLCASSFGVAPHETELSGLKNSV